MLNEAPRPQTPDEPTTTEFTIQDSPPPRFKFTANDKQLSTSPNGNTARAPHGRSEKDGGGAYKPSDADGKEPSHDQRRRETWMGSPRRLCSTGSAVYHKSASAVVGKESAQTHGGKTSNSLARRTALCFLLDHAYLAPFHDLVDAFGESMVSLHQEAN